MFQPIPRVFAGWRVLIAEDEIDSREVAQRLLTLAGADVTAVAHGAAALAAVRAEPAAFRLILTDLSMPEMDGWELLHHLKHDDGLATIPVIALTAHAMAGDRERGLAAGLLDYVTKPIDPVKFIPHLVSIVTQVPGLAPLLNQHSA